MTKRRYRKKIIPVRIGEMATKERCKHQGGMVTEVIDRDHSGRAIIKRHRAVAECVLDAYFIREQIEEPEYQAGMKFRRAYLRAVFRVRVDDVGAGSHRDPEMSAITVIHSERILQAAYATLELTEQAVVVAVCGHDSWAGGAYRIEILRRALKTLAVLWGFA